MAKILFIVAPELGHLNPSVGIAKGLASRGHRVIFAGTKNAEEMIRAHGFEFEQVLKNIFPDGIPKPVGLSPIHNLLNGRRFALDFTRALADPGNFLELFSSNFDLCIVDYEMPYCALYAHKFKVPTIMLNTSLPFYPDLMVPPITTSLVPEDNFISRMKVGLAWTKVLATAEISDRGQMMIGLPYPPGWVKQLAARCGFPLDRIQRKTGRLPRLDLPEIVLAPPSFDFPRANGSPLTKYVGASLDLVRKQPDFPWDQLAEGKPIILCTLGSKPEECKSYRKFFDSVLQGVGQDPRWQLVVGAGKFVDEFEATAGRAIVVRFAPQLDLLKRASLMITHAGMNSVQECIHFGVPMLAFPVRWDQPGNAARVTYHGIGRSSDISKVTPSAVAKLVEELMTEPRYRTRMTEMSNEFAKYRGIETAIELIETELRA